MRLRSFVFLTLLSPSFAFGASCNDLKTCAKAMYDLRGEHYVWEVDAEKPKIVAVPDIEMNKENAELVFTALLDHVRLARVPIGDGKTFRIVSSPLRKEMEVPTLDASFDHMPAFPNNWDWISMRYKTKDREQTDEIEKMYRLHLPREARMQSDSSAGILIVTGATPVVRQMYETIKAADVVPTPVMKKVRAEKEKAWLERQKILKNN